LNHPDRVRISDLIHRALIQAEIPVTKEPQGLSRDDGKRLDDVTLVPWQSGRSATRNVTVVHTLADWLLLTCREVRNRPELAQRRPLQRGARVLQLPSTGSRSNSSHMFFRWLSRLLVP